MSKFAIDPGHGCYPDTGAEGYLNEQNCALDIANRVISKLQYLGHQAWNARPSSASNVTNSLQQRCDNAANADLYNKLGAEVIASAIVQGLTGQSVGAHTEEPKKPYIVCFNNPVDERAALYLSEFLNCKCIDNSVVRMDYEPYYPICVGGGQFTSYCKKLLRGDDRFKTMKLVADFIEERR